MPDLDRVVCMNAVEYAPFALMQFFHSLTRVIVGEMKTKKGG